MTGVAMRLLSCLLVVLMLLSIPDVARASAGQADRALGRKVLPAAGRGVIYRLGSAGFRAAQRQASASCSVSCSGPLQYHGGTVMHAHKTYVIYWAPASPISNGQPATTFTPFSAEFEYEKTINGFLANVAADSHKLTNVYSVDVQYGEPSGGVYESTFGQAFKDEKLYPPRNTPLNLKEECPTSSNGGADGLPPEGQPCLTDGQIKTELKLFIAEHPGLPTGLGAMYFVLTPKGVDSCAGGTGTEAECNTNVYCAYHFDTTGPPLIYANMPYDHVPGCETPAEPNGTPADDEISTISHEHNEAVTDPQGTGWYYGELVENADKCTFPFFNPAEDANEVTDAYGPLLQGSSGFTAFNQVVNGDHYLVQREWSNAAGGCVTQAPVPAASFAVYSSEGMVGQPIAFNGSTSMTPAGALTSYSWNFGDGSAEVAGTQPTHTYASPGTYTVRLTVTNDSGASASTTQNVSVVTPSPAPQPIVLTKTVPVIVPLEPTAYTASQLASKLGLPTNGAKLSGRGPITVGHAECPPACTVAVRLYALRRVTVHGHRVVKRVFVGALTTKVAAKGSSKLMLRLNATGRKLLRKSHRLPAQLLVSVTGKEGGSWRITRKVTLTR